MSVMSTVKKGNINETPIAEISRTLNELASSAYSDDLHQYRRLVRQADEQGISDDQIKDSYTYGRRELGSAKFNFRGEVSK